MPYSGVNYRHLVRNEWLWLVLIVLLALALRFYKLGQWSLWGDEVSNIRDSLRVFELNIPRQSISRILSREVLLRWGTSEWYARLIPALIGAFTIPVLYLPLRKALGSRVALLTMLFLAVAPWHLYWSQNARFYTAALLFYTLALLSFFFFLEEDRIVYLFSAAIFLALAAQEHLTSLILVPVAAVYTLLLWLGPWQKPAGLRKRNILLVGIPGAAIALFMALPFVSNQFVMTELFGTPNNSPAWLVGGAVYYIGIPIVIAALGGFFLGWKTKDRATLLFGLSALIPMTVIALISLVQYSANRYIFVSLASWLALAAVAVAGASRKELRAMGLSAILLAAVLVASSLGEDFLYYQVQNGNREDWRGAIAWVEAQKSPEDKVYISDNRLGDYYLDDPSLGLSYYEIPYDKTETVPIWYVIDANLQRTRPDIVEWLQQEAELSSVFDVNYRARLFLMRVYRLAPNPE